MKKSLSITFALVAALALAGAAAAQVPPGVDVVGIYTTEAGGASYLPYTGSMVVNAYIVFHGLSRGGIAGWEMAVEQQGSGVMFLSATLFGTGPINITDPPRYQVGLGVPMTAPGPDGTYCVARESYFVLGPTPTLLYIRPYTFTSWPDDPGPGYANAYDVGDLVRVTPSSGSMDLPVFAFNEVIIPVAERTWGGVKGMFR